ncbi:MAG: rod shape-determining protein MreD [Bryobacteraceae bacterium]|nr:rod shape-determining protein MreD [Bryobacteraceae bacterium]MDW8376648.1 rod shape-determining protein MreD [Bryobacterales bacterium]
MKEFSERLFGDAARKAPIARFHPLIYVGLALAAILFQVYVPRLISFLSFLDLPLLITVYFALMRRSEIVGLGFGAFVGLVQDSLSHQPLGMFGIVKTLVGYFAGTLSHRGFDVENPLVRGILGFFFYAFHQLMYWIMVRALLGQPGDFNPRRELILGMLNAVVAIPLFHLLDKLKERG